VCGRSARTVRSGGGRKRAYGNDYSGTKPETADTDKSEPTRYRAGSRPYQALVGQRHAPRWKLPRSIGVGQAFRTSPPGPAMKVGVECFLVAHA